MTIEFDCSGCKTTLRLSDDMAGLRAQCVKCGEVLTIPSPTAHYWPPGSQQAAARSLAASTSSVVARPPAAAHVKPSAPPAPASACDTVVDLAETIVIPKAAPNVTNDVQGGSGVKNGNGVHGGNSVPSAASPGPAAAALSLAGAAGGWPRAQ